MTADAQQVRRVLRGRCLDPHQHSKRKDACDDSHCHLRPHRFLSAIHLPRGQSLAPRRSSRFLSGRVPWQRRCRDVYSFSSRLFRAATFFLNILLMRRSLVSFLRSVRSEWSIRRISGEVWIWCRTCALSSSMSFFERRFTSLLLNTPTGLPMWSLSSEFVFRGWIMKKTRGVYLPIRHAHC